jgi:pilus assembly protein CpaB
VNKRISLIIAGILAILAIFLVKIYLDQRARDLAIQAEKRARRKIESQVTVLVAKRDISAGEPLNASMFDIAVAPADQVPPQAVTSYDQIFRKEAAAPISKGEPILLNKLISSRHSVSREARVSLSKTTPVGKRAITIPVDQIASVGGMIKPGDYVDVLCSISIPVTKGKKKKKKEVILPLFQKVLVLAVGTELATSEGGYEVQKDKKKKKKSFAKMITLALAPQEANILAFVQEQGKIQMALRSPEDSHIENLQPASWETIFKYFMPQQEVKVKEEKALTIEPAAKIQTGEVEIYRGLKKEVVPIYK